MTTLSNCEETQRSLRVAVLIVAVVILNVLDLAYTLFAHRIGMLDEVNPLAQGFLQNGLTSSLIAFKALMLSSGLILLWRLRLSRWVPPACWVLVIAYVGLSVIWYLWVRDVNYTYETQAAVMVPHITQPYAP